MKFPFHFGYDAVATEKRRKAPLTDVKSEDDHLQPSERRKLVATTRDVRRNFSLVAWAVRKHLDYVASFSFQSKTGIKELDKSIEKLVRWWSLAENFDVAGRHGLHRFIRLAEACRVVDGDVFIHKLRTGHVQAIEGDRVANPSSGSGNGIDLSEYKRGVKCTKSGRPINYAVCNRNSSGTMLTFARIVPAKYMVQFGYWDRFDQIRGISPLATALNTFRDSNEGIGYALARAKVSQLFALVLKRATDKAIGRVDTDSSNDPSETTIDFGRGALMLDLDPEDTADFLETHQPAQEFQDFMQTMFSLCLKALDIPYSFYNEAFSNYSGSRQALLMYEQSAREKKMEVQALLDHLTNWRLQIWIADGILQLPAGMQVGDLKWEWQSGGLPWIDPWREIKADREAIDARLMSRQRIARRMGYDWEEIEEELEAEEKTIGKTDPSDESSKDEPVR